MITYLFNSALYIQLTTLLIQEDSVVKAAGDEETQQQLQARQCELRMLSLLCFSSGPLDAGGAKSMLRLMVGPA
jgi:hypothetical protein